MSKLTFNNDGTITIPTRKRGDVVLEEPTMWELAEMHRLIDEADEQLGTYQPLPEDATAAQVAERTELLSKRTDQAFSHASPHGLAWVQILNVIEEPDEPYTERDIPGWLCHPVASNRILVHFRAPLPGPDGQPTEPEPATED